MSRMFISKTIALLAALVVVFISITVPTNVYAYEDMDTAKNGSASLTLQLPAPSDSVKLYFVADMDTKTHITMRDEYDTVDRMSYRNIIVYTYSSTDGIKKSDWCDK